MSPFPPGGDGTGSEPDTLLLADVFEQTPSGLVLLDDSGLVFKANRAACTLLGGPLIGESWLAVIQRVFCLRPDDGHEVSLRDGRRVQLITQPLRQRPGQLIQLTDLTRTRQLQEQLGHLSRLSALGKMAASLAHQIRTPLAAAMLYGANLANRTLSPEARGSFQRKLMDRLKELEHQVSDVLLFARNGEQQVVSQVPLENLLLQVRQASEAMLHQAGAQLELLLPAEPVSLLANAEALTSAITNLLNNAVQAGATKLGIQVEAQAREVCLRVLDNGRGIAAEQLPRICEPFFTTRSQGTGLGLAVVQSVVQSHQGRLDVSSVEGKGSCFTLYLPLEHVQTPMLNAGGIT